MAALPLRLAAARSVFALGLVAESPWASQVDLHQRLVGPLPFEVLGLPFEPAAGSHTFEVAIAYNLLLEVAVLACLCPAVGPAAGRLDAAVAAAVAACCVLVAAPPLVGGPFASSLAAASKLVAAEPSWGSSSQYSQFAVVAFLYARKIVVHRR